MFHLSILSLVVLSLPHVTLASSSPHLITSKWAVPSEYKAIAPVPESSTHVITLSLYQRNIDELYKMADDVSNPRHPSYQQYPTLSKINQLTAPDPAHMTRALEWVFAAGITKQELKLLPHTIRIKTEAKNINQLFGTTLMHYQHTSPQAHIACNGSVALPEDIHKILALNTGVTTFPPKISHNVISGSSRRLTAVSQFGTFSPRDLASYYGYEDRSMRSKDNRTSAAAIQFNVVGEISDSFSPDDIRLQGRLANVPNIQSDPILFQGRNVGSDNPQNEASLDIQALTANNPVTTAWSWQNEGMNWIPIWVIDFEMLIDSGAVYPQVVTISYSSPEFIDPASREASDIALAKFALMGVTVMSSSGDSGASGSFNPRCMYDGAFAYDLYAEWPSTSPFVTSVGATQFKNPEGTTRDRNVPLCGLSSDSLPSGVTSGEGLANRVPWELVCLQDGDEVAAERPFTARDTFGTTFASGGGFSRVYARPDWQNTAVRSFLNSNSRMPPARYYNSSGRGVPDISMYGAGIAVLINGQMTVQGGTSLSSPLFAAFVAMMNEVSLQYTNRTLGNVNRLLYQMHEEYPKAFRDITEGSNRGTIQLYQASCEGFQTTPGWDPVTGLGSPRFAYVEAYLVHLFTGNPVVDPPDDDDSFSLSTGAIIGIAIGGAVAVIALIACFIIMCMCMCKKPQRQPPPQRAQNVRNGQHPVALVGAIAPAKQQSVPLQPLPAAPVVITSAPEPHYQYQPHADLAVLPTEHEQVHVVVQPDAHEPSAPTAMTVQPNAAT